jgi:peroxiredoxin
MNAYQAGIAKFEGMDAQVVGISTDLLPALRHWAEELKVGFPLASDFMRKVSASYGILDEQRGIASRTTFVIDPEGRIQHIEQGSDALDPTGAEQACSRIHKK